MEILMGKLLEIFRDSWRNSTMKNPLETPGKIYIEFCRQIRGDSGTDLWRHPQEYNI